MHELHGVTLPPTGMICIMQAHVYICHKEDVSFVQIKFPSVGGTKSQGKYAREGMWMQEMTKK